MDINTFTTKFFFRPEYRGYIGIERECFLARDGQITPAAVKILQRLPKDGTYGYELSACQLEMRTSPCLVADSFKELYKVEKLANEAASSLGLTLLHVPVAPSDMSLDVYPDPTGRYASIVKKLPTEVLSAACRVAAVHVHIGVQNHYEAIAVYNRLVDRFDELKKMGDTSHGRRLELYRFMASDATPAKYESWENFYEVMKQRNCLEDPRQCWDMIRISTHGTVEVRVFDSVADIGQITKWVNYISTCSSLPGRDF